MIELVAGGASDVGRVRSANQDSWMVADRLWAVADGMGGHRGGEVASQLTIEVLREAFDEYTATALADAARRANAAVHERASDDPELRGMGTTLCAMGLVDGDENTQGLSIINVGDSRCYQWRDGEMTQITRDHSLVEDMREAGQITEAEAAVHPHRNIVTRALGIQPEVTVDSFAVTPATGDRYVLCSDGLFNEVNADRIAATLRRLADPQDAASELVRQANEAGGRDNVTCVIVDVVDDDGAPERVFVDGSDHRDGHDRGPDMAGITTAQPAVAPDADPPDRPGSDGSTEDDASGVRLRRVSWRTAVFVLILAGILAVAVLAVGWYSRGTYYVGFQDDQVTIFKGRPQPVLWFEPTVERRTGIARAQVPAVMEDAVDQGREQSSMKDADAYVARMRSVICSDLRNGATLPPLAPGAPTTTIPAACDDLKPARRPPAATTTTSVTTTSPATSPPTTTKSADTTAP